MTMEQTAKLGIFIIKFIQDMKLDNSVGYNEEYPPQVVYVPDVPTPDLSKYEQGEPTKEEIDKEVQQAYEKHQIEDLKPEDIQDFINEISSKISDFQKFFKSGQFKI